MGAIVKVSGVIGFECEGVINFNGARDREIDGLAVQVTEAKHMWVQTEKGRRPRLFCSAAKIKREAFAGMTGFRSGEMKDLGDVFKNSAYGILCGFLIDGAKRRSALVLGRAEEVGEHSAYLRRDSQEGEFCTGANHSKDEKDKLRDSPIFRDTAGSWKAQQKFNIDLASLLLIQTQDNESLSATLGGLGVSTELNRGQFVEAAIRKEIAAKVPSMHKSGVLLSTEQAVALISYGLGAILGFDFVRNTGSMKAAAITIEVQVEEEVGEGENKQTVRFTKAFSSIESFTDYMKESGATFKKIYRNLDENS